MTTSAKKKMLVQNTAMWLAAMILPAVCSLAFASTKFPWPVVIPLLLLGCLLASNNMITRAFEARPEEGDAAAAKAGD